MKGKVTLYTALLFTAALFFVGCDGAPKQKDTAAEAPPPAQIVREGDASVVHVDQPEQFPLATAG